MTSTIDEELQNNEQLHFDEYSQSAELEQQAINNLNVGTINRNDDDLSNLKKSDTSDLKAHYLFNSKEENIIKDIVVSIQNFDKSVREKL